MDYKRLIIDNNDRDCRIAINIEGKYEKDSSNCIWAFIGR